MVTYNELERKRGNACPICFKRFKDSDPILELEATAIELVDAVRKSTTDPEHLFNGIIPAIYARTKIVHATCVEEPNNESTDEGSNRAEDTEASTEETESETGSA